MIKLIIFTAIASIAVLAQWLCMNEVNGLRAIYQWPSVRAFLAFMNPLASLMAAEESVKLVVAVVSRLENFEQRAMIRKTWKTLKAPETAFFFVMPEHPCPIDPQWRSQENECDPWKVQVLPTLVNEQVVNKPFRIIPTAKKVGSTKPGLARDGLGFRIKFPVAIQQLGLSKKALLMLTSQGNLTVEILDTSNQEVVLQASYSKQDLNIPCDDGFIYKKVDEENLHRGFEGILRIRPDAHWPSNKAKELSCTIDWNKIFGEDGPVVWTSSYMQNVAKPSVQNFCPLATMIYSIPDILELRQICSAVETQNKCQENKNRNVINKLVEEMEDNDDDIYLAPDLADSGSGASKSLISFVEWLTSSHSPASDFDYVLVTDDQSYVALDKLLPQLHKYLPTAQYEVPIKIWRSFFKYEKPVKHYGNEAVNHYFASYYPPVPSTGGSVISRDLATFLTHNMNHLIHGFSNIHNSMAVWLAPAAPSYYEDTDWFDDIYQAKTKQSIDKTFLGIGQITDRRLMASIHMNYTQCGKLNCL